MPEYAMQIEEEDIEFPDEWPVFREGELCDLKGVPFEVARLNASSLVLRPLAPEGYTARDVMQAIKWVSTAQDTTKRWGGRWIGTSSG